MQRTVHEPRAGLRLTHGRLGQGALGQQYGVGVDDRLGLAREVQRALGQLHRRERAVGHPPAELDRRAGLVLLDAEPGEPGQPGHCGRSPSSAHAAANRSAQAAGTDVLTLTNLSPNADDW